MLQPQNLLDQGVQAERLRFKLDEIRHRFDAVVTASQKPAKIQDFIEDDCTKKFVMRVPFGSGAFGLAMSYRKTSEIVVHEKTDRLPFENENSHSPAAS